MHLVCTLFPEFKGCINIVYHLCQDPCPVYGIDCAKPVSFLEFQVVKYGFYYCLAVVKCPFYCDIEDIFIRNGRHLEGLYPAYPAMGMQYEDVYILLTLYSIDGCAACISRGGSQDVHVLPVAFQKHGKHVAQYLERDILKCQGRAVKQFQDKIFARPGNGCYFRAVKGGVRPAYKLL